MNIIMGQLIYIAENKLFRDTARYMFVESQQSLKPQKSDPSDLENV